MSDSYCQILDVRFELGDTSDLPVMSDSELQYFIDKNSGNLNRTCLDVAKSMVFKLSMSSDESVDIFSIKGAAAAKQYMAALQMYIKNPDLNPMLKTTMPYASGISLSDMQANDANADNNIVQKPSESPSTFPDSYFEV